MFMPVFMQCTDTSLLFNRVTIDKSGCTFKNAFGSCGTGIYELRRVDVLWLFYFSTIKHEFGGCGTGNYDLERVDVLWLFYFCSSAKLNATVVIDLILNLEVEHSF